MAINRTNYEAYLIDYLEGNLSAGDQNMVQAFLLSNPDIQEELDGLSQTVLPPMDDVLDNKQDLYWNDEIDSVTVLMLEAIDGPLSSEKQAQLDVFLLEETARRTYQLLRTAVLKPSNDSFPTKDSLRIPAELSNTTMETLDTPVLLPVFLAYESKDGLHMPAEVDFNDPHMVAAALAEGDTVTNDAVNKVRAIAPLDELVEALKNMRLQPRAEAFGNKKSLKRKETKVIVFTPMVKRALAIAAVFVLGITIWRPWETEPIQTTIVANVQENAPTSADDSLSASSSASNPDQKQVASEHAQPTPRNVNKRKVMPIAPNDHSVAGHTDLKDIKKDEPQKEELPLIDLKPEEEMAEQKPIVAPVPNSAAPGPKSGDAFKPNAGQPVTLLAFIGDKLEDRFEQSPIYSYIERKKQQVFGTADGEESLRYERVSKADRIKQKLVLWGIEIERNKRKR
jgi:hypothetical protein